MHCKNCICDDCICVSENGPVHSSPDVWLTAWRRQQDDDQRAGDSDERERAMEQSDQPATRRLVSLEVTGRFNSVLAAGRGVYGYMLLYWLWLRGGDCLTMLLTVVRKGSVYCICDRYWLLERIRMFYRWSKWLIISFLHRFSEYVLYNKWILYNPWLF